MWRDAKSLVHRNEDAPKQTSKPAEKGTVLMAFAVRRWSTRRTSDVCNELDWEGISDTRFNSFIHSFLDFRASERRRQERESYELPKLSVAERNRTSACAGRVHMYICTHSSTECPGVAELPQQLDHATPSANADTKNPPFRAGVQVPQ